MGRQSDISYFFDFLENHFNEIDEITFHQPETFNGSVVSFDRNTDPPSLEINKPPKYVDFNRLQTIKASFKDEFDKADEVFNFSII